MPTRTRPTPHESRFAFGAVIALAIVLCIFGILLFAGGIWLIILGGSWYYLFAGAGLLLTAWFLFQRSMAAIWVYLLTYAGTVVWAYWEAGFDWWAQVPRIVAPTIVLLLVLLTIPVLRRRRLSMRSGVTALISTIALALGGYQATNAVIAQEGTAPAPVTNDPPELDSPGSATQPDSPEEEETADFTMPEAGTDWPAYGGSHHATRYSPLAQITPENVGALERIWEFRTGDMPPGDEAFSNQNTPLKIGNDLLLCSAMNQVISLDAATGLENWRYDPEVPLDAIPYNATCRGLAYFASPTLAADAPCAERVIMNTIDARLIAVDTGTGMLCDDFGTGGIVDLEEGIGHTVPGWYAPTSPPTIVRDVAVVHSQVRDGQRRNAPSGVVRGYNAETGALEWAWDMGRPGETGAPEEGETYTRGTPNVWTIASGDNDLGLVYLPVGNASVDYWGGMRSPLENEYSTALVALDVETGEVAWHYQTVNYDVWDYDLGSQGTLVDFPTPEGPVPAVILPTKLGMFFILDRATGELLVEVEERPVPQGGAEPDRISPTQPFVVDFPNTLNADIEERDMWGMTPLDQLYCRIQFHRANYEGIFTPPSADAPWIQYPGYNGGSDWGGIAVDPQRGIMIANYNDTPNYNQLVPREQVEQAGVEPIDNPDSANNPDNNISPQADTPYGIRVNAGWRVPFTGLLCKEPPYGGIMAIDLATREVLWDQPFGTARRNGPFGIPSMLPLDIGTPNNAGGVMTAGGLMFIAATTDNLIRAMDVATGEVLWHDTLPAGGQATPAVYEIDGRQVVVINAGGHSFMETPIGDYFIAYALPE